MDYRFEVQHLNEVPSLEHTFMPRATAPMVEPTVSSWSFYERQSELNNNKFQKFIMEGRYR